MFLKRSDRAIGLIHSSSPLLLTCLPRNLIMTTRGSSRRIRPHTQLSYVSLQRGQVCLGPLSTSLYIIRKRNAAFKIASTSLHFDVPVNLLSLEIPTHFS